MQYMLKLIHTINFMLSFLKEFYDIDNITIDDISYTRNKSKVHGNPKHPKLSVYCLETKKYKISVFEYKKKYISYKQHISYRRIKKYINE